MMTATALDCPISPSGRTAPAGNGARSKRKGVPVRSPCRRNMLDTPGVVFRFPSLISAVRATIPCEYKASLSTTLADPAHDRPGAVASSFVAAASKGNSLAAGLFSTSTNNIDADGSSSDLGPQQCSDDHPNDKPHVPSSSISTYLLRHSTPELTSNVLHYPELLSDLRDRLNSARNGSAVYVPDLISRPLYPDSHSISKRRSSSTSGSVAARRLAASSARRATGNGGPTSSPGRGYYYHHHHHSVGGSSGRRHKTSASVDQSKLFGSSRIDSVAGVNARRAGSEDGSLLAEISEVDDMVINGDGFAAEPSSTSTSYHRRHSTGDIESPNNSDVDDIDDDCGSGEYTGNDSLVNKTKARPSSNNGGYCNSRGFARRPGGGGGEYSLQYQASAAAAAAANSAVCSSTVIPSLSGSSVISSGNNNVAPPVVPTVGPSAVATNSTRRACASCGVNSTPCWRPGWIDHMSLCNSCGLRYKKGKVYCATCCYVPMKTEIATGGAIVCKRCSAHIQQQQQQQQGLTRSVVSNNNSNGGSNSNSSNSISGGGVVMSV